MKSENTFSLEVGNHKLSCLHFTGIMGSGMSALAQYLAWSGATVTGSDRIAFEEELKETRGKLERCGCAFFPQDGTGVHDRTDAVVVSTAIEEDNPDIAAARTRNMPVLHRSDILAAIVAGHRTIAVCGTSGKSTVTALVFEILHACGRDPSLLTGANLTRLEGKGLLGNAYKGTSGALVIEADESDGTLTKYRAETAVFLNISKDHQPVEKTLDLFREVADRTPVVFKNADDPGLAAVRADQIFGLSGAADWKPQTVHSLTPRVRFTVGKVDFELPAPGAHNLSNCLAAVAVCAADGLTLEQIAGAMREFKGISRRFSVSRTARGIVVIDDYAHNPEKIKAALLTARDFGRRVLAVFQPHG
ncbi:MAG TPA: Mur ligase domain-containing protein, partial [Thermodesulfobacteriota bacterium]|nr:Mur ligase domain-containing protein [Thermodesulfobacteriota bacterium]